MLTARGFNYLCYKYTPFFLKNNEMIIGIRDCGTNISKLYTSTESSGG